MTTSLGALGALALMLVALAALYPFVKGAARKSALELVERERDIERDARLAVEQRCKEDIAELRGQVHVLTEVFAKVIATEVIKALREGGALPRNGGRP